MHDDITLRKVDPNGFDPHKLSSFLEKGTMDLIPSFIDDFLRGTEEAMTYPMFRDYMVLNILYAVERFLRTYGSDSTDDDFYPNSMKIKDVASDADSIRHFLEQIIELGIQKREQGNDSRGRKGLRKALDYIEENYHMEELSLNMVANASGLSPNYFSAIFSQEMNQTFIEYLSAKRIEKAKILLRDTTLRSNDIAPAIGYHDPHYFAFVFKRLERCTPKEYRARIRKQYEKEQKTI